LISKEINFRLKNESAIAQSSTQKTAQPLNQEMHLLIPRQESQTRDFNFALLERETIIELNRDLCVK